ncbi:MAG TPA: tetratricopeptide repeat protein, partial [Pyrinomonadaceae bacterium]
MKARFPSLVFLALILWIVVINSDAKLQNQARTTGALQENAYRENNIGVALLEQFKYREGVDAFRRALTIAPKLTLAQINLSIALYNLPDLSAAQREAENAILLAPDTPQPYYILGMIAKSQSRMEDAIARFQRVLKIDPTDVGTNINLGQIYSQQRRYPEAIAAFRLALVNEPYNTTALYNLGTT